MSNAVGYVIAYALAADQLRRGTRTVVAECANPLVETRVTWRQTAERAAAVLVDVEVLCSDPDEHRRRVETRTVDVPDLVLPTWQEVLDHEYAPWEGDRLVTDTAHSSPGQGGRAIAQAVERARG